MNKILAVYIIGKVDPARKTIWHRNKNTIKNLVQSIKNNEQLVILNNCFKDKIVENIHYKRIEAYDIDVYFQKWFLCYDYLKEHEDIDKVWIVDVSDVEMLKNPFPEMENNLLYVGSEETNLNNEWMQLNHKSKILLDFQKENKDLKLLNAGIIGGSRNDVLDVCKAQIDFYNNNREEHDMGSYNYILYSNYKNKIKYGPTVHTIFKGYEEDNKIAWWKHK